MSSGVESLHKILKDETRRRIILFLQQNEGSTYMDLMKALGLTNTGKMNYHLKVLGNLLSKNDNGTYSLSEKGVLALRLIQEFSDPVGTLRTEEEFQRNMAFQRLRLGFELSTAVWILWILESIYFPWISDFLVLPMLILYVLSINERAGGWKLLGAQKTSWILWSCAIVIIAVAFPLAISALTILQESYALFIPFLFWAVYTCAENHSFNDLDIKFDLGLKKARFVALMGLAVFVIAYLLYLHANYGNLRYPLYYAPSYPVFLCAAPFLIISSVLLTNALRPAYD